jgi:succinoglycan biosynthesis transport protein ExoP
MFPPEPTKRPEWSPLSIARVLWKSKLLIILTWVSLCLVSAAVVFTLPSIYRAEAVILVDGQKIPERYVASTVNADVQDRLATITQQILATSRLQKIISTFHLYDRDKARMPQEEIIEMMRQDTKITPEKGWSQDRTGAFKVAYQGTDPAIAAEVANQIANLFIEENLRTRETHAEGTSEFLEEQLQQAKKTLDKLEVQFTAYKLQHRGELPEQENSLAASLSRLQIELEGNQEAFNRAEQSKALLTSSLSMAESTAKVLERTLALHEAAGERSRPGADDPNAPKDSAALQAQLDVLKSQYTDEHPDVIRLKKMLAQTRLQEKKDRQERAAAAAAVPDGNAGADAALSPELLQQRERIASLKTELALATQEIQTRNTERQDILNKIAAYQSRMDRLPVREQEMTGISRDYEIAKANYKSLLDKRIAADMATDLERRQKGERFTMIDPARPPAKPSSPDRPRWMAMGCSLGLFLAIFAGWAREFRRNVLLGEWELPSGVAILGRVSAISQPYKIARGEGRAALVAAAAIILAAAAFSMHLWL